MYSSMANEGMASIDRFLSLLPSRISPGTSNVVIDTTIADLFSWNQMRCNSIKQES
jgi:hypothetical protein